MLIERPSRLFRLCFPGALFRVNGCGRRVYLTFDDGPVPGATPLVLDILASRSVRATFFMVGENVRRYPELYRQVVDAGHAVGNHTMRHLQGVLTRTRNYLDDVEQGQEATGSHLLRPPHGLLRIRQFLALRRSGHRLVMYDLVSRDYSRRLTADNVVENVRRLVRPGSIIVFHDSVKALPRMRDALPRTIDMLSAAGYEFGLIGDEFTQSPPTK